MLQLKIKLINLAPATVREKTSTTMRSSSSSSSSTHTHTHNQPLPLRSKSKSLARLHYGALFVRFAGAELGSSFFSFCNSKFMLSCLAAKLGRLIIKKLMRRIYRCLLIYLQDVINVMDLQNLFVFSVICDTENSN